MIFLFIVLLAIIVILYISRVLTRVDQVKTGLSDFQTAPGQLPLVGHIGEISKEFQGRDGGTAWYCRVVQQLDHEPFVLYLFGTDHMLFVNKPETCAFVNKNSKMFPRGWGFRHNSAILGVQGQVLFTRVGKDWEEQRRRLHPHFKPVILREQYSSIVRCCEKLELQLDNGGTQELKALVARMTLDVIYSHLFGESLPDDSKPLIDFFEKDLAPEFQLRTGGFMYLPTFSRVTFFLARRKALNFLRERIQTCKGFVGGLPGTVEEKLNDVMGLVFAGFDTTSNSICWLLYHLYAKESQRGPRSSEERTQQTSERLRHLEVQRHSRRL